MQPRLPRESKGDATPPPPPPSRAHSGSRTKRARALQRGLQRGWGRKGVRLRKKDRRRVMGGDEATGWRRRKGRRRRGARRWLRRGRRTRGKRERCGGREERWGGGSRWSCSSCGGQRRIFVDEGGVECSGSTAVERDARVLVYVEKCKYSFGMKEKRFPRPPECTMVLW